MLFLGKKLDDISESDLVTLIGTERETKTLEFKRELPKRDKEAKIEFLADVSSFANASGGHILFGVDAKDGIASSLMGFDSIDIDAIKLDLENRVRDNIEPRLPSFTLKEVELASSKYIIIAQIPKSWIPPHVVNFQKHWRFYSRNSAGKYRLDVGQMRNSVLASETLREQTKNFRSERLANIIAGETPIFMAEVQKVVLHTIPLTAFSREDYISLQRIESDTRILSKLGYDYRYNFDGLMGSRIRVDGLSQYIQIFRNGIIEFCDAGIIGFSEDKKNIPSVGLEKELMGFLADFLWIYQQLGTETPILISLSLLNVKGCYMAVPQWHIRKQSERQPIDRDNLIASEILLDDLSESTSSILRPIFDTIWNACGWSGSLNYDQDGNWREPR